MESTNNKEKPKKPRTYTLCRVCNMQGRKGNALTLCNACEKHVHSRFCSTSSDSAVNGDLEGSSKIFICSICKSANTARRSVSVANTVNQPAAVRNSRHFASQATTPLPYARNTTVLKGGRRLSPTIKASSDTTCSSCNTSPGHMELEAELVRIKAVVQELKIISANINTPIQHLKQDNQRLVATVRNMQLMSSSPSTSMTSGAEQNSSILEGGNVIDRFSFNEPNKNSIQNSNNNNNNYTNHVNLDNNNNNSNSNLNFNHNNSIRSNKNIAYKNVTCRNNVKCDRENETKANCTAADRSVISHSYPPWESRASI